MRKHIEELTSFLDSLLAEGVNVDKTAIERATSSFTKDWFVDVEAFHKWKSSCKLLITMLGAFADPWRATLDNDQYRNSRSTVRAMLGAVASVKENVLAGRLARVEELVLAEAFSNLLDQAKYLLDKKYFLASGVLCRAVLEEKLRLLCDANGITLVKDRPTLADYNTSLYTAKVIDKLLMKSVDSMAAVGNDAAHNNASLTEADVVRMYSNLEDFLSRFS